MADVTHETVILELCAKSAKVDAFLRLLKPYGIVEAARSGELSWSRWLLLEKLIHAFASWSCLVFVNVRLGLTRNHDDATQPNG